MGNWLKQSTAVDIKLGPFVDSTDGVTAETGLTISQADVRLAKNNGAWAQKNDTTAAAHEENGWYEIELDATDTNTLGILIVAVNESGALPVWKEFTVLPANVYDSLVSGTDLLDANASQLGGTAQTGRDIGASVLLSSGTGTGQVTLTSGRVNADMTHIATASVSTSAAQLGVNVVNFGGSAGTFASGRPEVNTTHAAGTAWNSGAIGASTLASDTLTAAKVASDVGTEIGTAVWATTTRLLTAGTNIALAKGTGVTGFNDLDAAGIRSAVGLASANLDTQLSTIDTVVDSILVDTAEIGAAGAGLTSVALSAAGVDAIWDEAQSGHTTAGTFGRYLDSRLATIASDVLTNGTLIDGVNTVTAKLDDTLEDDGGTYRFTTNALEQGPGGGSAPTAGEIADAVWDEALAGHVGSGSTGEALSAAGGAGDPWITTLPGSYTSGQAGYILGTNLNATVGSRATQTSVDDVPTNSEFNARTLATADYGTAANQTTILARLGAFTGSGVNTILGFFRALMRKDGSITTPSDVGGTYDHTTDSTEAIRDRGDAAWITATGFSTHNAADVWASGTRTLTAGTNIVLAKGTGITGFNDVSTADINAQCDSALADYDAPTKAELDSAVALLATASALTTVGGNVTSIKAKTDLIPASPASTGDVTGVWTTAMTESYASDGATMTPAQALYMLLSLVAEFSIAGTTITCKKLDGSTTAMTYTLNDGTNPTSRTRAS